MPHTPSFHAVGWCYHRHGAWQPGPASGSMVKCALVSISAIVYTSLLRCGPFVAGVEIVTLCDYM